MVQLFPGLFYVIVLTVLFTVLLVSLTAVFLLSSARAIVHQRYVGRAFSKKNIETVAKLRPVLKTKIAVLLNVKDVESNRLLTTFKWPAVMRLYEKCLYVKPFFSSGAYLVRISDVKTVSIARDALEVAFVRGERTIVLRCRCSNLSTWLDSLNALI